MHTLELASDNTSDTILTVLDKLCMTKGKYKIKDGAFGWGVYN